MELQTNIKHNSYFIELIPHWSPGDQEDAHEFLTHVLLRNAERYL